MFTNPKAMMAMILVVAAMVVVVSALSWTARSRLVLVVDGPGSMTGDAPGAVSSADIVEQAQTLDHHVQIVIDGPGPMSGAATAPTIPDAVVRTLTAP
jgi:hypothetical protein